MARKPQPTSPTTVPTSRPDRRPLHENREHPRTVVPGVTNPDPWPEPTEPSKGKGTE